MSPSRLIYSLPGSPVTRPAPDSPQVLPPSQGLTGPPAHSRPQESGHLWGGCCPCLIPIPCPTQESPVTAETKGRQARSSASPAQANQVTVVSGIPCDGDPVTVSPAPPSPSFSVPHKPFLGLQDCGSPPAPHPLPDAQECLAAALCSEQRRPWRVRAPGLWYHVQHLWPAGQLPTGSGQDPDAGPR